MDISSILGEKDASYLLDYKPVLSKDLIHVPGPKFLDKVFSQNNRSKAVKANMARLYGHGRLANTGYLSILPQDQTVEHSAAASFAPNPIYFDPANLCELAIEAGCNGFASTYGQLASVSKKYVDRIPFIMKINHNDLLRYPTTYDQVQFASVKQAADMGCIAVGATIYWGSENSSRQLQEVSKAFAQAHELGLVTILWAYIRNDSFKVDGVDHSLSADLEGQANHLSTILGADIVKQKLSETNGGMNAIKVSKTHPRVYSELTTDHPIDLARWQVINCLAGRIPLINSGGESKGAGDLADAVRTAVINKRGGGAGLILGRKAFQKPMKEGIEIINSVQDVYLESNISVD